MNSVLIKSGLSTKWLIETVIRAQESCWDLSLPTASWSLRPSTHDAEWNSAVDNVTITRGCDWPIASDVSAVGGVTWLLSDCWRCADNGDQMQVDQFTFNQVEKAFLFDTAICWASAYHCVVGCRFWAIVIIIIPRSICWLISSSQMTLNQSWSVSSKKNDWTQWQNIYEKIGCARVSVANGRE